MRHLKLNLPNNEFIVHMDFAEDYSFWALNEVQPGYFNQTPVTLHPVVYHKGDNKMLVHTLFVIVSDEVPHAAPTVWAFMDQIVLKLQKLNPNIKALHYWTDSRTSR